MSSTDEGKPEGSSEITPEEKGEEKSLTTPEEAKDNVPLFDKSKMGFNDRAWNDPPSLLMNSSSANSGPPSGRKLNTRVAFPLDSASYPTSDNTARAPLNPNAPPPMGGFINSSSKPPLPPPSQP